MTSQRDLDLLVDLVKLLKKHGPETFKSLAESIDSMEMAQQLSSLLMQTVKINQSLPTYRSKNEGFKQETKIPRAVTNLIDVNPEKHRLLTKFYDDLITKSVLPSLRNIKEFALECGLPEIRTVSRQKAIGPLISAMANLPDEQLSAKLQSIKKFQPGDRSLDAWGNLILDR